MAAQTWRIESIDVARRLGAPSCLGTLGNFARTILQEAVLAVDKPTLIRVDITSAQVLDYRFVHLAFVEPLEQLLSNVLKPYRLVFRVRAGPQLRNLQLGLAWHGPGHSRPNTDEAEGRIAAAGRFAVAELAEPPHLAYLGVSSDERQLLSLLDRGFRSAVDLKADFHVGLEDMLGRLRRLVNKGFAVECSQETTGDGLYASVEHLLRGAQGEGNNGD